MCTRHCECARRAEGNGVGTAVISDGRSLQTGHAHPLILEPSCAGDGLDILAVASDSGPPSVDAAASLTDWSVDDSCREMADFRHESVCYHPKTVGVVEYDRSALGGEGSGGTHSATSGPGTARIVETLDTGTWRGRDVAHCAFGRVEYDVDSRTAPEVSVSQHGVTATLNGRSRRIRSLSDLMWTRWSSVAGDKRMAAAANGRFLVGRFLELVAMNIVDITSIRKAGNLFSILADSPLPYYPEYPEVHQLTKVSAPPSLWWDDVNVWTGLASGPSWVNSGLLLPSGWWVGDLGHSPPRRSVTDYQSRGSIERWGRDPWECLVMPLAGTACSIVVRVTDLEYYEQPVLLVDRTAVAGLLPPEGGHIVVGQDPGVILTGESSETVGLQVDVPLAGMETVYVSTLLDCKDVDRYVAEEGEGGVPVDPTLGAYSEWLCPREILCALNDSPFILPAQKGTGCYATVRGRQVSATGNIEFLPVDVGLLKPMVIVGRDGRLFEPCSGMHILSDGGHSTSRVSTRLNVLRRPSHSAAQNA